MEKNNGRRWTIAAFAFVCVALTGLTVAFANLSEQLDISQAAEVKSNEWKIEFENVSLKAPVGDATATEVEDLTILGTSISGIKVELKTPGDSVTYTFDVVNKGGINAKIGTVTTPTSSTINCEGRASNQEKADADAALVCDNITYLLTYSPGDDFENLEPSSSNGALGKATSSNNRRNMTLTITYETGGTKVPTDDVIIHGLDTVINYVQD